ncbi:hypothetical protein AB0878_08300 [Amycolatopsis sp. NPDC047767]|uniref:hypothetical protein n=1 Tax=Amycolatopsis sp. NPDC047767 TaxID=3156765 RepID=UPI003453F6CF
MPAVRRPRPWAAPLARPAARIALAGGLTLAGWLLGALIAGAGAEAAEQPHGDASGNTAVTAPGHTGHGEAREHRREPHGHPWHGASTGSTADSSAAGTSGDSKGSTGGTGSDAAATGTSGTSTSGETTSGKNASGTSTSGTSTSGETTSGKNASGTSTSGTDAAKPSASGTNASDESTSDQTATPAVSGDSTDSGATTGASQGGATAGSDQVGPDGSAGAKQHETGDCDGTHHSATDQTTSDPSAATDPSATDAPLRVTPSHQDGLLGGLLGGVLGLVDTTVHSITGVVGTVDDVGGTVLPPVTTVPGGDDAPPLIAIGDVLGPVFSGGTVSGGVTATVPELTAQPAEVVTAVVPVIVPQPAPVTVPKAAGLVHYPSVVHLIPVQQRSTGAQPAHNENSRVGVTGGGGSGGGGGLPAAPSAPVAPTTTANPGHDGPGGARQPFAVVGDSVTTTQLKLIGVSRDHEVAGAGRDAALPTTSPD